MIKKIKLAVEVVTVVFNVGLLVGKFFAEHKKQKGV